MKFRPALAVFGLGIVATGAAWGADDVAGAAADARRGKVLAYTCHGCHGVPNYKNAYPNYSVPKLGGQSPLYLANALKDYGAGERAHPTMHSQAVTLSDQDRADIAAFLSGEMVQSGKNVVGTSPPAAQTCAACHGADGATPVTPDIPILAGQHPDYIVQALAGYKSGKRKNPIMVGIVSGLAVQDFPAIAQFFSQQPGLCATDDIHEQGKCQKGE